MKSSKRSISKDIEDRRSERREEYAWDTDATVTSHPYGRVIPRPETYLDPHELRPVPSHRRRYPSDKGK